MEILKETHNVVIMDGSDKENVFTIMAMVSNIIEKEGKETFVGMSHLDDNHPTMVVIKYTSGKDNHSEIKKALDKQYPGLCIYDVAV